MTRLLRLALLAVLCVFAGHGLFVLVQDLRLWRDELATRSYFDETDEAGA